LKVQLSLVTTIHQNFNVLLLASKEFGTCVDCTSNQFEYYTELAKPRRNELLQKSIDLTKEIHDQFSPITFEELAVEVGVSILLFGMKSWAVIRLWKADIA
jgi:hypothetical protein